jgi:cation:H+ antiporter
LQFAAFVFKNHYICTQNKETMNILLLIGGLVLILLGANGLTDGASSIAKRFNIPSIVIGLTIVAFGTSTPELAVSVSSALKGSADIAIGNVVGSNIFNALMIVGCTALVAPIVITRNTLRKEIPLCVLSSVALFICANDMLFDKADANTLSITDGLLLLLHLVIFLGLYDCHCFQQKRRKQ